MGETVVQRFTREIREQWDYSPVWLPGSDVRVGDVGTIDENGRWFPKGSLADREVPVKLRRDRGRTSMEHVSSRGVTIEMGAGGGAHAPANLASAKAGFLASFTESGAVVMRLDGARDIGLVNYQAVTKAVAAAWASGDWDADLLFVTGIVEALSGVVLVASAKGGSAKVSLQAASARPGVGSAKGSVGFDISGSSNLAASFTSNEPFAALYRVEKLRASAMLGRLSNRRTLTQSRGIPARYGRQAAMPGRPPERIAMASAVGPALRLTPQALFMRVR